MAAQAKVRKNDTFADIPEFDPNPAATRMSLDNVSTEKAVKPIRALFTGDGGVGKTSLVCGAENAVIIDVEDGSHQQDGVASFPIPQSWEDILAAIKHLQLGNHTYKSLIIDTLDKAELMMSDTVCRENNWATLDAPGYGKGWSAAKNEWHKFLDELDILHKQGMNILLTAHTQIATFSNPDGSDYTAHIIKLNKRTAAMSTEWCDIVGYLAHEIIVDGKERKAIGKKHIMRFAPGATYEAKSRYNLPASLEMPASPKDNWKVFKAAFKEGMKK